jgi:hypothetical protein
MKWPANAQAYDADAYERLHEISLELTGQVPEPIPFSHRCPGPLERYFNDVAVRSFISAREAKFLHNPLMNMFFSKMGQAATQPLSYPPLRERVKRCRPGYRYRAVHQSRGTELTGQSS